MAGDLAKTVNGYEVAVAAHDALTRAASAAPEAERYDLGRMRDLMAHLGDPQDSFQVIHVAGTSGKTSTSYMIRNLIHAAGGRVGLTVSPHVVSVTERVQLGSSPLGPDRFADAVGRYLADTATSGLHPTYFELVVGLAYWTFRDAGVSHAVVETGLGGRLDATNVVTRVGKLCVISDIGLDHTEVLGETVEEIAAEKAGIVHHGDHVVIQDQPGAVLDVITAAAERCGASWEVVSTEQSDDARAAPGLAGYQLRNRQLARAAYARLARIERLPALPDLPTNADTTWLPPGRMETLHLAGTAILLDGAHNPQKLATLRDELGATGQGRLPVLANLSDAPVQKTREAAGIISDLASSVVVPPFVVAQDTVRRSTPVADMVRLLRAQGLDAVQPVASVAQGLDVLLADRPSAVLITGSLYLVSVARELLVDRGAAGVQPAAV